LVLVGYLLIAICFFARTIIAHVLLDMGFSGRWLLSTLLMVVALGVMVVNKLSVCSWMRRKNPAATISIIGGSLGAVACGLSPSPFLNKLWWAPLALDVIGVPYLLILAWMGIREVMRAEVPR
jgi:hypothetical protein